MESIKSASIKEYFSKIDFNSNWSVNGIKADMRKFLGEEPGIEIVYEKDVVMNESGDGSKEVEKIAKINVVYFDLDEKFKKIEFLL